MYEHPARRAPSQAPAVFYFETEGMCIGENNIRRPGDHRERAEGERPGPGPAKQRWEAVFRRERRPESLDRFSTAGGCPPADLAWQGENAVSHAVFSLQILMDQRSDLYENQFQEAGPGRRAVRRGRGGQYASVSRIRQPVRASAAHGQCHLRRVPGPGLRRGRGLPGQPAAQHLRLRQPPGLPRQHVRRPAVRTGCLLYTSDAADDLLLWA